jgi:predicted dehydrogenase
MFQKDTYISVDFLDGASEIYRLVDAGSPEASRGMRIGATPKALLHDKPRIPKINPLKYELERFLDAVAGRIRPPVTGADGLLALNVAHEILETIRASTPDHAARPAR